jgi:hypothetical protein
MTAATVTVTRPDTDFDFDAVAVCDYCLEPAAARDMVHLVVGGVTLDICAVDALELARRRVVDRAFILRRLARLYAGGVGAAA